MAQSFAWGIVASSSLMLGGILALRLQFSRRVLGVVMAFGSGVLISAVSFELVDDAFETSSWHGGVAVGLFAGSLTFFAGDWLIDRLGGEDRKHSGGKQAAGFGLAIGRYDVGAYLWLELAIAVATAVVAVVFFSRRARAPLARLVPLLERVRLARPLGALYRGLHAYRDHPGAVGAMLALTIGVQALRILAIWLCGEAVGVHLSPLPYFVMGPMFFLVMLAPFTLNGFALREAFFVSFLGQLGVSADRAFATGFLYFLLAVAQSLPGAVIWLVEGLRGPARQRDHAGAESGAGERPLQEPERGRYAGGEPADPVRRL